MKYKIRGTFEVEFDTDDTEGLESVLSENAQEELAVEWLYQGCGLISDELVPSLIGHSVRLDGFEIEEVDAFSSHTKLIDGVWR